MEVINFENFLKKYIKNQKSQEIQDEIEEIEDQDVIIEYSNQKSQDEIEDQEIQDEIEEIEDQDVIIEYSYDELDEDILNDLRKYNITKEVFYANNLKVLQIKSRKFLYELLDEEFVNKNYKELTKVKFLCFKNRLKLYPPLDNKQNYFINKKDLSILYIPPSVTNNTSITSDTLYIVKSELEAIYFNTLNKQSVALINFTFKEKDFENLINFISERNIKKICIVFDREIDREKREKLYKKLCYLAIKLLLMNFDVKVYDKNNELEFIDIVHDKQDVLSFLKKSGSYNVVKEIEIVNKLAKKFNVSLNSLLQDLYKYTDDEIKNKILSILQSRERELLDVVNMLLSSDNLIETIEQDFKNLYVDVKQAMLFYFILLSRKVKNLNRNFIVTLQGQSRLFFVTNLLKLIDEDDVIQISHLSKKALYYTNENLNCKLIFLNNIKEEVSDVIKKIIFDKKLVVRSVSAESNLIKKEKNCNATPVICYTLEDKELRDVSINFDLNCNVSDIVKLKANQSKIESIQVKYRIVDILLRSYEVVIPDLQKIAKNFTNLIEFERFEDLVKISTVLHQYKRKRVNDKLIASFYDYEIAMFLLSESKKHEIDKIDKDVEVVLRAIKFLQKKKQRNITRKELVRFLSKKLNKTERTIANYLKKSKKYVIIEGRGRGGAIVKLN
ncbi:MAG: hypothetical protein QXI77_03675 [Nanopusillaceae archaeon]